MDVGQETPKKVECQDWG